MPSPATRNLAPPKTSTFSILPAPKNATAVYAALVEFGAPLQVRATPDSEPRPPTRRLTANDFAEKGTWYTMGVPPVAIDILSEIPGVTCSGAWKNRSTEVIDESTGLTAHFISRHDLIAAKLAAGRPRDLADVDELRKAAAELTLSAKTQPPKSPAKRKKAPR